MRTKLEKLENIKNAGMNPYPEKTDRNKTNAEALENFDKLVGQEIILAGRVKSMRPMGGSAFAHIDDGTEKIQLFLNKKNLGNANLQIDANQRIANDANEVDKFKLFIKNIELGDFVEATGKLFKTKQDEKTLEVSDWKVLSKNIRPIPTEYFGLKDTEELLRKRYLDLMMNSETRELFKKKNIFWQTIRNFLASAGFLEVQAPVLEAIPGGADAEPFTTHHNALDRDFYLRISLELALKRLLVGGYEKVFEIGRVFRNEGIDREHLQEYDSVEFYAAYWDMQKGMDFSGDLFRTIVKNVTGGLITEYEGNKIDWSKKPARNASHSDAGGFPVVDYFEEFEKETGLDLSEDLSIETLRAKADELGIKYEKGYGKGKMIDTIYKKTVRQKLIQPCFLTGHPIEVSPLAKKDPKNLKKVLRFQLVVGRGELCNAFAELNDPIDQRKRFEEQMKAREAGDKEAQMLDEDFVEALEYGLPPAFGFGMSERFFAFLMNKSVRETVIFPPIREK